MHYLLNCHFLCILRVAWGLVLLTMDGSGEDGTWSTQWQNTLDEANIETQRISTKLLLGYVEKIVIPAPQKLPNHTEKLSKAPSTQIPLCLKHFCPKNLMSPLWTNSFPKIHTCRINPSDVWKWHTYFVRMIKTNWKNLTIPFFLYDERMSIT